MKFFDVGQEATGVIAIGQIATGVVAIGQVATGVIAIGQVARGFVAVGMGAFGLVSVGMLGVGVVNATGMIGIGGSAGKGFVLPLMPFPRVTPFAIKKLDEVLSGSVAGFVRATLGLDPSGEPKLLVDAKPLPAVIAPALLGAARARAQGPEPMVIAYLEPPTERGGPFRAERLIALPAAALSLPIRLTVWAFCFAAMLGLSVAFYELVAIPLLEALLAA